jgi:choline monooxygenase
MPTMSEGALAHLVTRYDPDLPLAEARTIPGAWYTDPRVFELEEREVFGATWQLVGRADQVAAPGQYVTATVGGEPIVVVRGKDGELRAFYNVCRHHAAAVVTEPEGQAERLKCPYHGWVYSLEGHLKVVPEWDGVCKFAREDNGLVPVAVATWENKVFVHLGAEPPSLDAYLGRMAPLAAPLGLGALTFVERREWTMACNWKVFVDNYLDGGYHIPFLHRGLNSILPFGDYQIECFERACLQSSPVDTTGGDAVTSSVRKGRAQYFWLYPNLMLNWYEGYLDTNLVLPIGVNETRVVFDFYFADTSPAARERNAKSIEVSAGIQQEDLAICASVQKGLRSKAYDTGRLSVRREAGEHLFHRLLAQDLRRGAGV